MSGNLIVNKMTLSEFITNNGFDHSHAMDLLQANGIVSDNAESPDDVAQCDHGKAIQWLWNLWKK
jgi:hypothetical protein